MAAKKKVTKKAPAKKAARKSTRKPPVKKAPAKKKPAKKAPAKKTPAKKTAGRKAPAKKSAAKKAPAKKTAAKKAPAKKTAPKEAPARKTAPKETAKSTPSADKDPANKAPAGKPEPKGEAINNAPPPAAIPKIPVKPVKLTVFVRKQRQKLRDLRDQLMDAMYGVQQDTLRNAAEGSEASGSGMHQGDAGSDAYDRDFALTLLTKEQDSLHEIEAALERIDYGLYGICEMSGKKIPHPRLEAIPFARLTVECQTRWEKEFPQRPFRSDDAEAKAMIENKGATVSLDEGGK